MRRELVQAALIGTSAAGAPSSEGQGDAMAAAAATSNERRLLLAAGIDAVRFRAGHEPRKAAAPPPPCPDDAWPECSLKVRELLDTVLETGDVDLLVEAAQRLAAVRRRVPSLLVPDFLDAPRRAERRRPDVIAALRPVLGERGRWIASLAGEAWAWAAQADDDGPRPEDETTWKEGTAAERVAVLVRQRRAAPQVARDWLAAVWKTERADERANFLATFGHGLSPADEPFLESTLDDRSASVRGIAASHLAKLPGSAFARRAEERAAAMLVWTPPVPPSFWRKLRGAAPLASLDATPPEDAPDEKAGPRRVDVQIDGLGPRAYRLAQAIALVPPSRWNELFKSSAAELIAATATSEWRRAVLVGWLDATFAFRAEAWAAALANHWPPGEDLPDGAWDKLVDTMAREDAERAIESRLRDPARKAVPDVYTAVRALRAPWGSAFSGTVIESLRCAVKADPRLPWSVLRVLTASAPAWPVAAIPDVVAFSESLTLESAEAKPRDDLVATFRLRQRIHQEIVP